VERIADNIWRLRYPLAVLGQKLGRAVTIVRLQSGRFVIHSTAPFTAADIAALRELGDPGWILDATLFHDSFAKEGCRAFERIPYLAPSGFKDVAEVQTRPLSPAPPEWAGELDVFPLAGMPRVQEHVMYHRPSRTLIVCDLLFNLGSSDSAWTRFLVRNVMGLRNGIGMSFFFRIMIRDRTAWKESMQPILACEFDRIIVGHGEIIDQNAPQVLREALAARDLLP
jgi:hypothetical protein